MKPKFGEVIRLGVRKDLAPIINDADSTIISTMHNVLIKAVNEIDDDIVNRIKIMAMHKGIDTVYLLDKKNILSALEKQIPKKVRVKKISAESLAYICPCCTKKQISRIAGEWVAGQKNLYCPTCGQALDWR